MDFVLFSLLVDDDKSAASVFGSLHGLLLALIPKYFSADEWAQSLRPVTDAELVMQSTLAPSLTARKGTTLFERDARGLSRDICKNLLSYCQTSTDIADRSGMFVRRRNGGP